MTPALDRKGVGSPKSSLASPGAHFQLGERPKAMGWEVIGRHRHPTQASSEHTHTFRNVHQREKKGKTGVGEERERREGEGERKTKEAKLGLERWLHS